MKATSLAIRLSMLSIVVACSGNMPERAPRPDLSVITQEQMLSNHFYSAYDAVQSMRSNWLSTHGPDSFRTPSQVLVYFDDIRLGGIETLRSISTRDIFYIGHYDSLAATMRWGVGHNGGVIYVSSRPASHTTSY